MGRFVENGVDAMGHLQIYGGVMTYPPEFEHLHDTRLDLIKRTEWDAWYAAIAPWLTHDRADVRAACLERLTMAAFCAEDTGTPAMRPAQAVTVARAEWLLGQVMAANGVWPDTIAGLLRMLPYKLPRDAALGTLIGWVGRLIAPDDAPDGLVRGTQLLLSVAMTDDDDTPFAAALDDDDMCVRACAARAIAMVSTRDEAALYALIGAAERKRAGVAGPFWSERQFCDAPVGLDPAVWMIDLMETRYGEAPADLPFNDIEFYLHELCDHSPDFVRRMMAAGRMDLAIETATEARRIVPGMADVLHDLAQSGDAHVARRAGRYLAQYHGVRHPAASGVAEVLPLANGARMIGLRFFCTEGRWDMVVFFAADGAQFDEAEADRLCALVLPPEGRGAMVPPLRSFSDMMPLILQGQRLVAYANHGQITSDGDTDTQRWHRVEVHVRGGIDGVRYHAIG